MIKLFVGLGNPGPAYESTRHNMGFEWIDALAAAFNTTLRSERDFHGLVARHAVNGQPVWLLKPQTYMNLSGRSVGALLRFFKILPQEMLVAHDELDLPPGEAKLKFGGGHAGHNGLRDIHAQLGTGDFWRLRVGIGHPGHRSEVSNWVLGKPSLDQHIAMAQSLDRARLALAHLLNGDMDKATLLIHTRQPTRPQPAPTLAKPLASRPPINPSASHGD
jgi:PTH1 family peptidyl-tRNA hydrolase